MRLPGFLMMLHRDWEAADAVQAAWPHFDIQRKWNGWAALRLDGPGLCITARTPLELGERIAAVRSIR